MYHFIENMSFPPHKSDSDILCGEPKEKGVRATNNIYLVSCPKCLEKIKKCQVCGQPVPETKISSNEFFIGCEKHKEDAQNMTTKYFKENPDFTKWKQ